MTKPEFYRYYAKENGVRIIDAEERCESVLRSLACCVQENDKVYLRDFGTFRKKTFKGRTVGDLKNGGTMTYPDYEKIVFTPQFGESTNK